MSAQSKTDRIRTESRPNGGNTLSGTQNVFSVHKKRIFGNPEKLFCISRKTFGKYIPTRARPNSTVRQPETKFGVASCTRLLKIIFNSGLSGKILQKKGRGCTKKKYYLCHV